MHLFFLVGSMRLFRIYGRKELLLRGPEVTIARSSCLVVASTLIIAGLMLSRSAGGVLTVCMLLPLLIALVAFTRSILAGIVTVVVVAIVLVIPLMIPLSSGEDISADTSLATYLGDRLLDDNDEETMLHGRAAAWDIFGDFPLFGSGLGTFNRAYPAYKTGRGPMLYFAHCDPLQWAAETGVSGTLVACAILVVFAGTVINGLLRLKDTFQKRLLLGAACACLGFLMHGIVDFPLQIPGVTVLFLATAAVCVLTASDRIGRREERDYTF